MSLNAAWNLASLQRHRGGVYLRSPIAFLSPAAIFGLQPSPKHFPGGLSERCCLDPVDVVRSRRTSLSRVSVIVGRDEGQEPRRQQLLAVHPLRRRVERVTYANRSIRRVPMAMTPTSAVRELLELIAAIDRRVPQIQRAGEASIARDAARLKARALERIKELEREPMRADTV